MSQAGAGVAVGGAGFGVAVGGIGLVVGVGGTGVGVAVAVGLAVAVAVAVACECPPPTEAGVFVDRERALLLPDALLLPPLLNTLLRQAHMTRTTSTTPHPMPACAFVDAVR